MRRDKMIQEIVIQHVQPEKRDEYIKVFGEILTKANYGGSHGIKFFTSIEDPSRVILMIEWDSVEAHTQHRGTPTHNAMREATAKYQTAKSEGAHFLQHQIK
ncbi:MAG: antibiotic biosynthesis monooxygenase [Deltaproteobacteria bacterium]|nr:antibiotic biosynthesis monooxygenase [Deltaproteobacteria bacterium]